MRCTRRIHRSPTHTQTVTGYLSRISIFSQNRIFWKYSTIHVTQHHVLWFFVSITSPILHIYMHPLNYVFLDFLSCFCKTRCWATWMDVCFQKNPVLRKYWNPTEISRNRLCVRRGSMDTSSASHEQNPSRHLWKFSRDIVFKTPLKTPFQDTSVLKRRLEKKVRCLGEPSWKKRSIFKTVHQDAFSRRLFKTPFKTTFQDTYVSWKNRLCLDNI